MKSNGKDDRVYPIDEFQLGTGQRVLDKSLENVDCRKKVKQCANYVDGLCVVNDVECWQKDVRYCNCRYMQQCVLPPELNRRVRSG